MIWFSASCNFTILPNSVGLLALPLRMISVDGSNRLTSLPSLRVLPRKMRVLVCFITRLTSGIISSSSWRSPSSASCRRLARRRFDPAGALGLDQRRVILLGLLHIGDGECADGFVERVALAAVARDHGGVARLGVRQRERPSAQATVIGKRLDIVDSGTALHISQLPYVEVPAPYP